MRVDGRDITVAGNLLQPLTRRTNDIVRLALSAAFLAIVVTSSLITRSDWVGLEKSISRIVGVLTPTQSNLVYLAYGIAIVALPFVILIGLMTSHRRLGTACERRPRGRPRKRNGGTNRALLPRLPLRPLHVPLWVSLACFRACPNTLR